MKRKVLIVLLIIVALGSLLAWRILGGDNEFRLDQIHLQDRMLTRVEQGSIVQAIELTGNLQPVQEKDLSFPFSGDIVEVLVEEGDLVQEGELLLRADQTRQERDYLRAKNNYERALIDGSDSEIRERELDMQVASSDLEATLLTAPFAGIISELRVENKERFTAGEPVINLIATDSYKVEVEIDEVDLTRVQPGQEVLIEVDAIAGQSFTGIIDRMAFRARNSGGVVTLPVTVLLTEHHQDFRPSLTAELQIIIEEVADEMVVPLTAVYTVEGQQYVVGVEDGNPVPHPVITGPDDGVNIIIREGLELNQQVLINAYLLDAEFRDQPTGIFGAGMPMNARGDF